jgi:hypothetical protein
MFRHVTPFLALVVLWLLPNLAGAADGDAQQRHLIESAKKDAKMVFYIFVETEFARALTADSKRSTRSLRRTFFVPPMRRFSAA